MLVEEFSGGVVVLDRKMRAGDTIIIGRLLYQRQCRPDAGMAEIADADLCRFRRERLCRDRERLRRGDDRADRSDPPADHGSSQMILLDLANDDLANDDLADDGGLSALQSERAGRTLWLAT